ncbi:MAG: hypothetical protein Q9187_008524 [Circinaria calcarea]
MPDYGGLATDRHEGISSSQSNRASSCSSIISKDDQATTKQPYEGKSVELQRWKKMFSRVADLRDEVYLSRLRLREKRVQLREGSEVLRELDSKWMSALRQFWQQGFLPDRSAFEKMYAELEEKRDEIGSLQYEYNQAEDEHEMIEVRLDKKEALLLVPHHPITDQEELDNQSVSTHTSNSTDYPSVLSKNNQSGSLYSRYQSRLGDERIIRERLQDRYIDLDKRKPQAVGGIGFEDAREDTASVRESKLAIAEAENELWSIEKDLDDMRKQLRENHIEMLQRAVPQKSLESVYGQMPSRQDLVDHHVPAHCSDSGLNHVQIRVQGDRSRYKKLLECLKNYSVNQVHREAVGQADLSDYLADRIWLRFVLQRYDDVGEIAAVGPGQPTKLQRLSVKEHWIKAVRILVLDPSGVSTVIHEYDNQFPTAGAGHNGISRPSCKIRGLNGNLDLDLPSQYNKARSV